jgi:phosphopantothenoylcysteine decarboxylase/phosphopantothenate--cysteine ligase
MPEPEVLLEYIARALTVKDLKGKTVLVTAGPTREKLDPVRFISNLSTGKMGYAIAEAAVRRGANVILVSGPTALDCPLGVNRIDIVSASDMADAVIRNAKNADIVIKAAAVADFRPASIAEEKIKKHDNEDMTISLERTQDILGYLGKHKREGQFLCGFSMETQNMIENTRSKLESKNVDLMVANNVKQEGAGFGVDTNVVTLISADDMIELPLQSKGEVADKLLDYILGHM